MKTIVETRSFTELLSEFMDDEGYRQFQADLVAQPHMGPIIPGCDGLRKVRVEDRARGKGKRGGARVIYLDIPEAHRIDLLAIYGKDEKDDLSSEEKKALTALAKQAKAEAVAATRMARQRDE